MHKAYKFHFATLAAALSLTSAAVLAQTAPTHAEVMVPVGSTAPSTGVSAGASVGASSTAPIVPVFVRLTSIEIKGNTIFGTPTLMALFANVVGEPRTFAEIDALADRLTGFYRANGHPNARGYVPAQEMTNGALTLGVMENGNKKI